MVNNEKLPLFATRMNLQYVNQKLLTTNKGHKLLKLKSDALNQHFRKIEEKYKKLNQNVENLFKDAHMALHKAQFLGANLDLYIKDSEKYPITLNVTSESISGVTLPNFQTETSHTFEEIHGKGAMQFQDARRRFKSLFEFLVEMSSVRNSYMALKNSLDATNRRVNSLEHLLIPKLENTHKFISTELDEQEREDFFRLKKIQSINKNRK